MAPENVACRDKNIVGTAVVVHIIFWSHKNSLLCTCINEGIFEWVWIAEIFSVEYFIATMSNTSEFYYKSNYFLKYNEE